MRQVRVQVGSTGLWLQFWNIIILSVGHRGYYSQGAPACGHAWWCGQSSERKVAPPLAPPARAALRVLLQPHGVLPHRLAPLVVAGLSAEGEAFGQPEGAVLPLPLGHDHHQQQNEQDDDDSDGEEVEQLGGFGTQGFTWKCERRGRCR